mmetsp:Transcript_22924/g.35506  ORF Transcript_22924/g.35506 Transcript_22924/m.35506 type:complete len:103 (+) Transcript_22924:552-860(+)
MIVYSYFLCSVMLLTMQQYSAQLFGLFPKGPKGEKYLDVYLYLLKAQKIILEDERGKTSETDLNTRNSKDFRSSDTSLLLICLLSLHEKPVENYSADMINFH